VSFQSTAYSSLTYADLAFTPPPSPLPRPVFGPPNTEAFDGVYSKLKQHGIARTSTWTYSADESASDGEGEKAVFRGFSRADREPRVGLRR
jgi:hypothetical protein